ncbi:DUF748 domain-containing protein [Janthinobacterium aquaticum]|nr:DUF748 domain-containing protein [Janthinobacterium sp. FT58W]
MGASCVLAVYGAAGFWLAPALIQSQLPQFVEKQLARQASIGSVSFNPFTLRMVAHDIAFKEAPAAGSAPLFELKQLVVQLEWSSIARRAWSIADIRLTAPSAHLSIAADGSFNLAQVLASWQQNHPDKSEGAMPRLLIKHFALEQGKLAWQDRQAGYADDFTPIDFTLDNISTLPDAHGSYRFSADAAHGGKLAWRGTASLSPLKGEGELVLSDAALPGLAAYLKAYTRATVTSGTLSASLPYAFAYADGKLDARVQQASLALRELALLQPGQAAPFASVSALKINGVNADLASRHVKIGQVALDGASLAARRDASGQLDLAQLALPRPAISPAKAPAQSGKWQVDLQQLTLKQVNLTATDQTVRPALAVSARDLQLTTRVQLQQTASGLQIVADDAQLQLTKLAMQRGAQTPFSLAQLGFTGGRLDLAKHSIKLGTLNASGAQIDLARSSDGKFAIASNLPVFATAQPPGQASAPWTTQIDKLALSGFGARFDDAGTGIKATLQDAYLNLSGISNDTRQALPFELGVALREGGNLSASGRFTPGSGALESQLKVAQLALAPLQPLLAQHLKLTLASGTLSGNGRLTLGGGVAKSPKVAYAGAVEIAGLRLNEDDGDRFASWKSVRADKLTASVGPNLLDIPELRVIEPNAQLIIENDRSLNAQRLLVQAPATTPPAPEAAPAPDAAFPVRVRRVRLQNAKLDFADLSLRPQFAAKIVELNGVVTGLSTRRDARSQIELDGRVDDYGMARVRGQLNPFAPTDNTELNVVFKNIDMVSASPYTMKFAGYKIAEGKISLDLQYKVRQQQLEGSNQVVLDKLTLGERIDSPDALKLPLELALAILKDSDGRIDLALPVSGKLNDPQFSYGAVVWKALGNVLTRVVSAPFRALGNLLGISAEKLASVDFDAGSAALQPPEREKLLQVAQILAKRPQLTLAVPAHYSDSDATALRVQAVRRAVALQAGIKLEAGEEPGPLNLDGRKMRSALREVYAARLGKAALEAKKKAAEAAAPATAEKVPVLQRLGKLIEGEPQVADPSAFYTGLRTELEERQALPADAMATLGRQRSAAIMALLAQQGVAAERLQAGAVEKTEAAPGAPVALKLELAARRSD